MQATVTVVAKQSTGTLSKDGTDPLPVAISEACRVCDMAGGPWVRLDHFARVVDQFAGTATTSRRSRRPTDDTFTEPTRPRGRRRAPRRARGSADYDEIYRDESPGTRRRRGSGPRALAIVRPSRLGFALVAQGLDNAQEIAKRPAGRHSRHRRPSLAADRTCQRLADYRGDLTCARGRTAVHRRGVLLLAPHGVELSSEAPGGLHERRFFNQV